MNAKETRPFCANKGCGEFADMFVTPMLAHYLGDGQPLCQTHTIEWLRVSVENEAENIIGPIPQEWLS